MNQPSKETIKLLLQLIRPTTDKIAREMQEKEKGQRNFEQSSIRGEET